MPSEIPERVISFEGVGNFRDLGGYRTGDGRSVRWRRLFRSAALHFMTPTDVARAQRLGIKTVLDLRRTNEMRVGLGPFVVPPIHHCPLPLLPEDGTKQLDDRFGPFPSADRYFGYLSFGAKPFVDTLELLARPETYPAIFHCSFGKDRTGVIAAFVLDILGVDTQTIIEDYTLTNLALNDVQELRKRIFEQRRQEGKLLAGEVLRELPPRDKVAPAEAISGFLERVRSEFGSSRGYFEARGVRQNVFDRLAAILLE